MKFPLSWLKEYLATALSPSQIAETLTMIGLEVEKVIEEDGDHIFDVAITPNLGHCASIIGIARELAAITEEKLTLPSIAVQEAKGASIKNLTSVKVENPELCPRYFCRVVTDLAVQSSPEWLCKRLEACGLRPVNNVVDITNYVLLEYGHPLHAFDLDKLEGRRIVVRCAKKGESIEALDHRVYYPTEETLLICDAKAPVAIAGVMGSLETEVTQATKTVLIESAYFEPTQVRRTSKRMGILTEASRRFERGTDSNVLSLVLNRAATLLQEVAQGKIAAGTIELSDREFLPLEITCRANRVNAVLGSQLAQGEIEDIFQRLGFKIKGTQNGTIRVLVPTYRVDVRHEIDLIEEVARIYGFDNFLRQHEVSFREGTLTHSPIYIFEREIRTRLIAEGLQEMMTSNLIGPTLANLIAPDFPKRSFISLLNPVSIDQSLLRPSLLPGLLQAIKLNAAHGHFSVSAFEVGKIHFKTKETYYEPSLSSIILTGKRSPSHFDPKPQDVDFFDLKGIVENLLEGLHIPNVRFASSQFKIFHPGRQAAIFIDAQEIGSMGEIHPDTLKSLNLSQPVYFVEINLETLLPWANKETTMSPLPVFPTSTRDWTFTLRKDCPLGDVLKEILSQKPAFLEKVFLLDLYQSEKIGSDWTNVTLRFVYRDQKKTISFDEVEKAHEKILVRVIEKLKLSVKNIG